MSKDCSCFTQTIKYNSRDLVQTLTKIDTKNWPWIPNKCAKFQSVWRMTLRVRAIFVSVLKVHESLLTHIPETVFYKFGMYSLQVGKHLHKNLAPTRIKIMELWMHENRNFAVPVNNYTHLYIVGMHTVFLGHMTHYHVSWSARFLYRTFSRINMKFALIGRTRVVQRNFIVFASLQVKVRLSSSYTLFAFCTNWVMCLSLYQN